MLLQYGGLVASAGECPDVGGLRGAETAVITKLPGLEDSLRLYLPPALNVRNSSLSGSHSAPILRKNVQAFA